MDILKLLSGTKEEYVPKGEVVEHKNKETICKIMPENYSIKGLIEYEVVPKQAGKSAGLRGRQDFTASELFNLAKKNAFLRNLRDLRDMGDGNPYEKFVAVALVPKEEAEKYFNIKEEYKVIALTNKQETEIKGKTKIKIALLAFTEQKRAMDNLSEEDIQKMLGISIEELEDTTKEEMGDLDELCFGEEAKAE